MSEPLQFQCPKCGQPAKVSAEQHGTHWRCQRCGVKFEIPATTASAAVSPPSPGLPSAPDEPAFIHVTCQCGKHFRTRPEYAGRTARCPACREKIRIPSAGRGQNGAETRGHGDAENASRKAAGANTDSEPGSRSRRPLLALAVIGGILVLAGGAFVVGRMTQKTPESQSTSAITEPASPSAQPPAGPRNLPTPPTTAAQKSGDHALATAQPAEAETSISIEASEAELDEAELAEAAALQPAATGQPRTGTTATQPADGPPQILTEDHVITGHRGAISDLAFSPDGRYLASSASRPDSCVYLWDAATRREVRRFEATGNGYVSGIAFSPDGRQLLNSDGARAQLWEVETGQPLGVLDAGKSTLLTIAFAHHGPIALTAGWSATIRLWNLQNTTEIRQFTAPVNKIMAAVFSPDDRVIAAGGIDGIVCVFDPQTGKILRQWQTDSPQITGIQFAPDGKSLLIAGSSVTRAKKGQPATVTLAENPLCLWDLEGNEIRRFPAPPNGIRVARFSPDGRFVLSAQYRQSGNPASTPDASTMALWEVASGQEVCRFTGYSASVYAACFSRDARQIAAGGADRIIRFWRLPDSIEIEPAEPPAPVEQRGLPDISKSLTEDVPALIEEGQLAEAYKLVEEARRDLRQFAIYGGVPLWDNSVGGLLRLADTKKLLLIKKGYPGSGDIGGSGQAGAPVPPPSTERVTSEQIKALAAIRAVLNEAAQKIRQGEFAAGQSEISQAQEQLRAFVDASGMPEWHLAVASVYQLAAKRQTELDNRRGVEESRAAALAAEAAKQKEAEAAPAAASRGLSVGQPAPLFNAVTVDGRPFALQQFRKKWVLIDFWATWCGPCRAEMPNLKDVYATFGGDKRFAMISLSIDNQVDDPLQYAQENGLGWIQGFLGQGWNSPVLKRYDVHGIPAMFLIDPDGKIAATGLRGERIKSTIAKVLGDR